MERHPSTLACCRWEGGEGEEEEKRKKRRREERKGRRGEEGRKRGKELESMVEVWNTQVGYSCSQAQPPLHKLHYSGQNWGLGQRVCVVSWSRKI